MTLLSWICRQVWGYTVLAAIVAGWFLGWKAGAAGAVLAYGVAMLALWEKPRPVVLSVRPDRRGRDYEAAGRCDPAATGCEAEELR